MADGGRCPTCEKKIVVEPVIVTEICPTCGRKHLRLVENKIK